MTTVNLVDQQSRAIQRVLPDSKCKTLHGDVSFDQACPENWEDFLSKADVVVSVAAKALFLLRRGFLRLD